MNNLLKNDQGLQMRLYRKKLIQQKAKEICHQLETERSRSNLNLSDPNIFSLLSQLWEIAGEYEQLSNHDHP